MEEEKTENAGSFKITRKKRNDDLNKLIIKAKEDSAAQFQLGTKYYNGDGVEQNYEEAFKWFTKSAENGNSQAQYNLAVMYEDGDGVKQNIDEAVKWYKESAKNGNNDSIEALKELGIDYKKEPITPEEQFQFASNCYKEQNYEEAVKWFTKSAERGNSQAQYNLAVMYEDGEGVKQNIDEAIKWYKESAKNGNNDSIEALKELGIDYKKEPITPEEQFQFASNYYKEKKYEEAFIWYKKSAEQGFNKAQYILGTMYSKGEGVKQDYEEAFKWFGRSAENGTAKAQYDLGMKYYNGNAVKQNSEEAFKWFKKSAEQGYPQAQYNLGAMYEDGEGVEENLQEAKKWYKMAADNGDEDAKEALKELGVEEEQEEISVSKQPIAVNLNKETEENSVALNLLNEEESKGEKQYLSTEFYKVAVQAHENGDYEKAFNYFLKSAKLDNAKAQYNLAVMYEDGEGVEEDLQEAKKWYKMAADNGDEDAKEALMELEKTDNEPNTLNPYLLNNMYGYTTNGIPSDTPQYEVPTQTKQNKNYWSAIFQNPFTAYKQAFNKELPENNFDISKWEKKFNWGAFLLGGGWITWNCNFWIGVFFCFTYNLLPLFCILGPVGLGMMIMFGNYPDWVNSILGFFAGSGCLCYFLSPIVWLVFAIWLGFNGNKIAYKVRPYRDLEHFEKNQKMWAWLPLWLSIISIILQIILQFILYSSFGYY